MKAIIVGAGAMGRAWGRNLLSVPDDVEVVGWVDVRDGAAAQAADDLGVSASYLGVDLGKAIAQTRPDFVVDVTVPEAHRDITLQALAAGVPVIGEKPMASSMEQAREMVAASEKAGKLYMVSQSRRYNNHLKALRRLVAERLGAVGIVDSDFYIGAHFGGFREEMRSPLILDMAIHTFDAARFITGLDPVAVYCEEFNPPWSWYRGDVSANAIFEMQGGARYTYRGSWCAEGKSTSWDADWRIVGEHGTAVWDGATDSPPSAEIVRPAENTPFIRDTDPYVAEVADDPQGIAGSLREFLVALRTGATPMGECHDNIKSLAMVFAAMESSDLGRRIEIRG